jgi:plastin-1
LNPSACPIIFDEDLMVRADRAIQNATNLGVNVFIKPKDICDGNKKLNISLVAQLFNTCHGLTVEEEQQVAFDFSALEIDDAGDTREERVFRMWINSLNIDGVYINELFSEMMDGVNLLKVMDTVQPGAVIWKK